MWVSTVLLLMKRSSAISALVFPLATAARTSHSRAVRGSMGWGGAVERSAVANAWRSLL
jgi:hypothetical protein